MDGGVARRRAAVPPDWLVDRTTGYEHARLLEHALLDRAGFAAVAELWAETTGDDRPYHEGELHARREAIAGGLRPDVERVARAAVAAGSPPTATCIMSARR